MINSENDFKVWDRFEMKKKMKDYHDLHIKCDVLLFEKFIKPLFESTRFRVGSNAYYDFNLVQIHPCICFRRNG